MDALSPLPATIPVLREAELRRLIPVERALEIIREAYREYGELRHVLSSPPAMELRAGDNVFKLKGGLAAGRGIAGFRLIGMNSRGVTSHCLLLDAGSGALLAAVEESWLHRLRTAATAAVAATWLARGDAHRLAIIGTGRIARELPAAFCQAMPQIDDTRVWGRSPDSAGHVAAQYSDGRGVRSVADLARAVDGADIIVAVTSATSPVLMAEHFAPGVTLIGLGGGPELDLSILDCADRFIVDDIEFATELGSAAGWITSGRSRDAIAARLTADIGEIAIGRKSGRTDDAERVCALIQGMASCDVALAAAAFGAAGA